MNMSHAIIYADRYYKSADGKTAHGLVRFSKRFKIECVIDSTINDGDAGEILDGIPRFIPLYSNLEKAYDKTDADTFIIGAVSEGGILPDGYDKAIT